MWLAKAGSSVAGETRFMHLIVLIEFGMPSASVRMPFWCPMAKLDVSQTSFRQISVDSGYIEGVKKKWGTATVALNPLRGSGDKGPV